MKKDIRISNLKGLLIFLVVFGHVMEVNREQLHELYVYIYTFHMPLFIFVSGFLSKRVKIAKLINLVFLYFIFQTFFNWYLYTLGEYHTLPFHYGIPQFHLWYIVSLGYWYAIAWIINRFNVGLFKQWIINVTIFIICFFSRWYLEEIDYFIGYYYEGFNSFTLSYQRTFTFLPFFLAGFFIKEHNLNKLYHLVSNVKVKVTLLSISPLFIFLLIQQYPKLENLFWGSFGSATFLTPPPTITSYIIFVTLHYIIAFGMSLLIITSISNRNTILTKWGDHSLPIFLFHPVFVFYFWNLSFYENWKTDTKLLLFFLLSLVFTLFLGSNVFVTITKYICNPYFSLVKLIKVNSKS